MIRLLQWSQCEICSLRAGGIGWYCRFWLGWFFFRRPDAFLNAQFWAEDGVVWYRQAYEIGWPSLLIPQNGYFQSISKLTALLSLNFDLAHAPLFYNLVAAFFNLLPVLLLNTERGRDLVPSTGARVLLSMLYLAHPYSREVHVNVTNIHWHLSVAALLLLMFRDWRGAWRKAGDVALTLLSGLSGPFSIFMAPLAWWRVLHAGSRRSVVLAVLLSATATMQIIAVLATSESRSNANLGATAPLLAQIFAGQVVLGGVLGDLWADLGGWPEWGGVSWIPWLLTAFGMAAFVRGYRVANTSERLLIVFGSMIFTAALLAPQISNKELQWPLFAHPYTGGRYAFIPIIALYASLLLVAVRDSRRSARVVARIALAMVLLVGVPVSWKLQPFINLHFAEHARRFEWAPAGERIRIPINPQGWSMTLVKKPPAGDQMPRAQ